MRMLVGESGTVTTEHDEAEFRMLGSYVLSGSLSGLEAMRHMGDEPDPDYIGRWHQLLRQLAI